MASQATYQITAKGRLADGWTDWFNGAIIRVEHGQGGSPHTILTCHVKDQAELLGIDVTRHANLPVVYGSWHKRLCPK